MNNSPGAKGIFLQFFEKASTLRVEPNTTLNRRRPNEVDCVKAIAGL